MAAFPKFRPPPTPVPYTSKEKEKIVSDLDAIEARHLAREGKKQAIKEELETILLAINYSAKRGHFQINSNEFNFSGIKFAETIHALEARAFVVKRVGETTYIISWET